MNICFVAHYAYRALSDQASGHIGGVERQTNLMAKWLAQRGHRVSVIVWGAEEPLQAEIDGVRIIGICRPDAGVPGLRFFMPRWTSLVRALRKADSEIYYHNCAEYVTGQVALWARLNDRRFVYSVASDPECEPGLAMLRSRREKLLFRAGLRYADAVITQSEKQKCMLEAGSGIRSTVLAMPCAVPDTPPPDAATRSDRVLWIGRLDPVKRVELLLAAARACPHREFDVVGPDGGDTKYMEAIRDMADRIPNVTLHGGVDFSGVWRFLRDAGVLCCTSRFEGFPNTFLEAWSQGLPVLSTVDPDDIINSESLGALITDPQDCGSTIDRFLSDPELRVRCSRNALAYFRSRHEKDTAMQRFEAFFENVVRDSSRSDVHNPARNP